MALRSFKPTRTSGTRANASERAGAAAPVLLVGVRVAEPLGQGAVLQPELQVGQIPPVRTRSKRDLPHAALHQGTHVLNERNASIGPCPFLHFSGHVQSRQEIICASFTND